MKTGDYILFDGAVAVILEMGMDEDYFDVLWPAHEVLKVRYLTGVYAGLTDVVYMDDVTPIDIVAALGAIENERG